MLPTTEVQIHHYYTTSIYENFLSLASLTDRTCAVSPFVNFSPSPTPATKKSHPLTQLPRQRNIVMTEGVRVGGGGELKGIAKLGSCAGQSILHIRDTPLSQHINCTLYILHVYAAWRKKMAYICVKRNTTSCSIGYVQKIFLFNKSNIFRSRFQWPRGLRRRSGAARLPG